MNHSPSEIIVPFLIKATLATDPANGLQWPAYRTTMPDGDGVEDECIAVIDTAGDLKASMMSGESVFARGMQILFRSVTHHAGWDKAHVTATVLDLLSGDSQTVDDDTYKLLNVARTSDILSIGQEPDAKQRWLFSINLLITFESTVADLFEPQVKALVRSNDYNTSGLINSTDDLHTLVNEELV